MEIRKMLRELLHLDPPVGQMRDLAEKLAAERHAEERQARAIKRVEEKITEFQHTADNTARAAYAASRILAGKRH